jgi:hypothetical protein
MRQHRQRIEQMLLNHGERVADCGQVVGAVPFLEQPHVIEQAIARRGGQRQRELAEAAIERSLRRHALFLSRARNPRFKCTSKSEIAAGVTPEMRAACPMVSGRWRFSFCCTSADKPRTSR